MWNIATAPDEAAAALERRWEALLPSHLGVLATEAAFADCDPDRITQVLVNLLGNANGNGVALDLQT